MWPNCIWYSIVHVFGSIPLGPDSEAEGTRPQPKRGNQHHGCHWRAGPGGSRGHALLRGRAVPHRHGDATGLQFSGQERGGAVDLWAPGGEHWVREGGRERGGRGGRGREGEREGGRKGGRGEGGREREEKEREGRERRREGGRERLDTGLRMVCEGGRAFRYILSG